MKSYQNRFKGYRVFSPDKSFFQLGIVWLTFTIILIFGITATENYTCCMSANCFETFLTSYKLPMWVLSLLIPFVAIYAAQHRSELTIAQITSAESQNNFINYYKHLEEFRAHLENNEVIGECQNYRSTHFRFFQNSRGGDYKISADSQNVIRLKLSKIYKGFRTSESYSLSKFEGDETNAINHVTQEVIKIRAMINELLHYFQVSNDKLDNENDHNEKVMSGRFKMEVLVKSTKHYIKLLKYITDFCHDYRQPPSMNALSHIEVESQGYLTSDAKFYFNLVDCGEDGNTIVIKASTIKTSSEVLSPTITLGQIKY